MSTLGEYRRNHRPTEECTSSPSSSAAGRRARGGDRRERHGSDGALAAAAAVPASSPGVVANGQEPLHAGRLRRWHKLTSWGFVFSDLHNCDVFLDGANAERPDLFEEGDFVLFRLAAEEGERSCASARKASMEEVWRQQALNEASYHQQAQPMRGAEEADPPRHADAVQPGRPSAQSGMEVAKSATKGGLAEASQRTFVPPPPPPPVHPPAGFAKQAGLMPHAAHQHQVYNQGQGQPYTPYMGFQQDQQHASFMPGGWPGNETVLNMTGLGTQISASSSAPPPLQLPGTRVLLAPPPALAACDPQAVKRALEVESGSTSSSSSGAGAFGKARTMNASRSSAGSTLGAEWAAMLKQAREVVEHQQQQQQQHGSSEDQHHHNPFHQHHHHHIDSGGGWDTAWGWGVSAAGPMDGHGDYGGCSMSLQHSMMGMHGDASLYASAAAS